MDKDNKLNIVEYVIAKFLIWACEQNQPVPSSIPPQLVASVSSSPQLNPSAVPRPPIDSLFLPSLNISYFRFQAEESVNLLPSRQ